MYPKDQMHLIHYNNKRCDLSQYNQNIVIVTWKGGENFGTCLQGYALQEKLFSFGYTVHILSDVPHSKGLKSWIQWAMSCIGLMQLRIWCKRRHDLQTNKRMRWERKAYRSLSLWTKWQVKRLVRRTDCFVTGSDQIWNTYHHFMPMQFLDFAGNKKRIAYASSIGTSKFKPEYELQIRKWLLEFQHIGVREQEAVRTIKDLTGRMDVVQVVDPTLLITASEWREFALDADIEIEIPNHYIFCYLVGNNHWYVDQLKVVQNASGLRLVIVPACENREFEVENAIVYQYATAVEFVALIDRADFVCTDSFHATAFCINLNKPFVEFMRFKDEDEESQNSRIYDFLNHYGLANRIYNEKSTDWSKSIEYAPITALLEADRERSLNYLIDSIER